MRPAMSRRPMPTPIMPACTRTARTAAGYGYDAPPPGYGYRLSAAPGYYAPIPIMATRLSLRLRPRLLLRPRRVASASALAAAMAGSWRRLPPPLSRLTLLLEDGRDCMVPAVFFCRLAMPPKTNPAKLNPLQLKTLTLLQAIARIPGRVQADARGRYRHHRLPARPWRSLPPGRRHAWRRATPPGWKTRMCGTR